MSARHRTLRFFGFEAEGTGLKDGGAPRAPGLAPDCNCNTWQTPPCPEHRGPNDAGLGTGIFANSGVTPAPLK